MKLAATLTTQVMEGLVRLPAFPTLDWADRAAAALTRIHHPCSVLVFLGQVDMGGFILNTEAIGAATSSSTPPSITPSSPSDLRTDPLQPLRTAFTPGAWVGWPHCPTDTAVATHIASELGVLNQPDNPVRKRWQSQGRPEEVLAACMFLPPPPPPPGAPAAPASARVLLAELCPAAGADFDLPLTEAILTAVLPLLAQRAKHALGVTPTPKHDWLTPKEELILWHLLAGKSVPDIAAELQRSVYTVHDHVKSLHKKLGANSRGELVARALGHLNPMDPAAGLLTG